VDHIIPGNDDAIRSISLITSKVADACLEGKQQYTEKMHAEKDKEGEPLEEVPAGQLLREEKAGPEVEIVNPSEEREAEQE